MIPIGWLQVQLIILDNLGLSSELLENVALGLPVLQASNGSKNTIAHVSNRIGIVVRIDKWFRGAWNKTRTSTVDHRTTLAVKNTKLISEYQADSLTYIHRVPFSFPVLGLFI